MKRIQFKTARGLTVLSVTLITVVIAAVFTVWQRGQACPSASCSGKGAKAGTASCGPLLAMVNPKDLPRQVIPTQPTLTPPSCTPVKPPASPRSPALTPQEIRSFTPKQRFAAMPAARAPAATGPIRVLVQQGNPPINNDEVTLLAEIDRAEILKLGVQGCKVSFYVGEQLIGDACPGKPQIIWRTRDYSPGEYEVTARIIPFDFATRTYGTEKARAKAQVTVVH